ncbi:MAG: hypothetical protein HY545_01710, partial [Candidatus Doudnabacteria bacterium]|nr:hypothetical protein [Candidatus Doudnabacteria bacterium]
SPLQLLGYPVQNLISLFGKPGYWVWQRVNGLEIDEINPNIEYRNPKQIQISNDQNPKAEFGTFEHLNLDIVSDLEFRASDFTRKSFGHSWVLNFRTMDKERLRPVILRLAEKAARRMRAEGLMAYDFYLSIRMVDGSLIAKSKKLKFAINTGLELYEQALILWKDWRFHADIMHIAVGFRDLVEYSRQLELNYGLTDCGLQDCLDVINNKYGEFTVRSGLLTNTQDYAPDAIAFGR